MIEKNSDNNQILNEKANIESKNDENLNQIRIERIHNLLNQYKKVSTNLHFSVENGQNLKKNLKEYNFL